jgi:hypothetical protein
MFDFLFYGVIVLLLQLAQALVHTLLHLAVGGIAIEVVHLRGVGLKVI